MLAARPTTASSANDHQPAPISPTHLHFHRALEARDYPTAASILIAQSWHALETTTRSVTREPLHRA